MTLTEKIYLFIKAHKKGVTSAQIHRFTKGTGDATRLCRFLMADKRVYGKKAVVNGMTQRYKLYYAI